MAISDRALIAGALVAGACAIFARSGFAKSGGVPAVRWQPEEVDAMNLKLASKGISSVMLGNFATAPTPDALVNSVFRDNGAFAAAQLTGQLLTHVFGFADRAGQLYRAAVTAGGGSRVWIRDQALELELSTK